MSGITWLDSLVDLDFEGIQDHISKSVEEASRLIDEVNNLEILNLDALAAKQDDELERENDDDSLDEDVNPETHNSNVVQHNREIESEDVHNLDSKQLTQGNVSNIGLTRVKKMELEEDNWSADFSATEGINLVDSLNPTDLPYRTLMSSGTSYHDANADSYNDNDTFINSMRDQSGLPSIVGQSIDDMRERTEFAAKPSNIHPIKSGLLLPKRDVKSEFENNMASHDDDHVETIIKKKRKKKKHDKGGLDFWGFSTGEDLKTNDSVDGDIEKNDQTYMLDSYSTLAINQDSLADVMDAANKLPHRIVSGLLGASMSTLSYSFFDKIEDEIDLEDDPVIRSVQDNISRPKSTPSSGFMDNPTIVSLSNTFSQWNSALPANQASVPLLSSASVDGDELQQPATSSSAHQFVVVIQSIITTVGPYLYCLAIKAIELSNWMCYGASQVIITSSNTQSASVLWNDLSRPETRYSAMRRIGAKLWEIVSSVYGLSALTGVLLVMSYFKFRRFGTDAGD